MKDEARKQLVKIVKTYGIKILDEPRKVEGLLKDFCGDCKREIFSIVNALKEGAANAWYDSNSGRKTQEVGQKKGNELGLYDMSGNVWEWCSDWYDGGYYSKSPTTNPHNSTAGSNRVNRGGSWYYFATAVRVARRDFRSPTNTNNNLGFRITARHNVEIPGV